MPAPTVEMGLGGTWNGVAASHFPNDHAICAMRLYPYPSVAYDLRLAVSVVSDELSDGSAYFVDADVAQLNVQSDLPGNGCGVSFDGVADETLLTSMLGPGARAFSIDVVIQIEAAPSPGDVPYILGFTGAGVGDFALTYESDGRVHGYYNGASVVDAAMSTGAMHHVALTRSGAATDVITLYIDGASVDTASIALVTLLDYPLGIWQIAYESDGPYFLECTIYGFGLYAGELTSAMVAASYAALSWTDVTQDVLGAQSLVFERGIRDDKPNNRVASTGALTFAMNNLASNSGGVTGYYSPGHASCRAGFAKGTPVRVKSGSDVIFVGRIRSIAPTPGKTSGSLSRVLVTDYLDSAATSLLDSVPILEDVTGDVVFERIVRTLPQQPNGIITFTGSETYTLALDNTRDESVTLLEEMHRLAVSELGYVYQLNDGRLVYEARASRITNEPTATVTLADTMHGMDVAEVSSTSLNRVQVTVHPRDIDAAATTVLFTLINPLQIAAGETKTILGPYRTAASPGITTRIGGLDMVTPVATTDYLMNTESDGSGTNLTASLSIYTTFGANGVRFVLTNDSTDTGYITLLQARGRGVYDFRTVVLRAQDDAAVAADGVNAIALDMVYQEDVSLGQSLADSILGGYRDLSGTRVRTVSFFPDAAGMPAGLFTKDISDRVAVSESITGATGEYYINGVKHEYRNGTLPRITWWLAPAEPVSFWVLETSDDLGTDTMLAA